MYRRLTLLQQILLLLIPSSVVLIQGYRHTTTAIIPLTQETLHTIYIIGAVISSILLRSIILHAYTRKHTDRLTHKHGRALTLYSSIGLVLYVTQVLDTIGIPEHMVLLPIPLIMMTIVYGTSQAIYHLTKHYSYRKMRFTLLKAIAMPVSIFATIKLIETFDHHVRGRHEQALMIISMAIIIGLSIAFLFYIGQTIYILFHKQQQSKTLKGKWVIRTVCLLLGPLFAILINNGNIIGPIQHRLRGAKQSGEPLFGDFTHRLWYTLTIINAFLFAPRTNNKRSLPLFFGQCLGLIFVMYFAAIIIPLLPLAMVGLFFFGLGLLAFLPLIALYIQSTIIIPHLQWINNTYHKSITTIIIIGAILIFPSIIIYQAHQDKQHITQLVQSVHTHQELHITPQQQKTYTDILDYLWEKNNHSNDIPGLHIGARKRQPYISPLYDRIALGGLTLSDNKISSLYNLITDHISHTIGMGLDKIEQQTPRKNDYLTLNDPQTETQQHSGYTSTRAHFHIDSTASRNQEFHGHITIDDDIFVSNYYLVMSGHKEYALLSDKQSAIWLYDQITRQRRDPGIIYYQQPGLLETKVFPVMPSGAQFGIEFIHDTHQPITIQTTSPNTIDVTNSTQTGQQILGQQDIPPHYYLLINTSPKTSAPLQQQKQQLQTFIQEAKLTADQYTILAIDRNQKAYTDSQEIENITTGHGGFWLEKARSQIAKSNSLLKYPNIPIIVFADQYITKDAIISPKMLSYISLLPTTHYLTLSNNRPVYIEQLGAKHPSSEQQDFHSYELQQAIQDLPLNPHYQRPQSFLEQCPLTDKNYSCNPYQQAQQLQQHYHERLIEPNKHSPTDIIQTSIARNILSPLTSFISLETEAQKKMLRHKQQQILAGDLNLDHDPTPANTRRMSEPSWLLRIIMLVVIGLTIRKRAHKQSNIINKY